MTGGTEIQTFGKESVVGKPREKWEVQTGKVRKPKEEVFSLKLVLFIYYCAFSVLK